MIEKIVSLKSLQGEKERKVKKRPRPSSPQRNKHPVDLGLSGKIFNVGCVYNVMIGMLWLARIDFVLLTAGQ